MLFRSSSHYHRSSLSTSRSASISTRAATPDMQNVYQIPLTVLEPRGESICLTNGKHMSVSIMRIEFMDEIYDFPLPATSPRQSRVLNGPVRPVVKIQTQDFASSSRRHRSDSKIKEPTSATTKSSHTSGRSKRSIASSDISRGSHASKQALHAEVEMVSKEQVGYWNASYVARIPAVEIGRAHV